MKPVKTARSNFVYRGPTLDIGDAWVERQRVRAPEGDVDVVWMDWQLDDDDRQAIADGALVRLGIWGMEPIPPVSLAARQLEIVDEQPPAPKEPGS